MFSAVITGSFYVLDISKKRFIYIKPDDLLLCGYSVKEAMKLLIVFRSVEQPKTTRNTQA